MTLSDVQLIDVLDRTVAIIDPVLDVLADADPLDLKPRTRDAQPPTDSDSVCDRTAGALAWTLDAAEWPGTAAWESMPITERARWWVSRVGAVTTAAVAFPGVFGAAARALPLGTYLGYASQALVLRAVAREYGARSRAAGIALLAQVLFDRDVSAALNDLDDGADESPRPSRTAVLSSLWRIGRTLYELSTSLDARPAAPRILRWGAMLPIVGGPVTYLGETIALRRAVTAAQKWIVAHPTTVEPA